MKSCKYRFSVSPEQWNMQEENPEPFAPGELKDFCCYPKHVKKAREFGQRLLLTSKGYYAPLNLVFPDGFVIVSKCEDCQVGEAPDKPKKEAYPCLSCEYQPNWSVANENPIHLVGVTASHHGHCQYPLPACIQKNLLWLYHRVSGERVVCDSYSNYITECLIAMMAEGDDG